MTEFDRDEALAFIEAMRLTLGDRVGYRHMSEKLLALAAYVRSVTDENEQLRAYLDSVGSRAGWEALSAEHPAPGTPGDTGREGTS